MSITALILAGGRGNRMGGLDKGLLDFAGRPLIETQLERIATVVDHILISANRHLDHYAQYGYPVLTDSRADYPGPLAGIERGLSQCESEYLWVVPCDAPGVDAGLLERLLEACADITVAASVPRDATGVQATFALLRPRVAESLRDYLDQGRRKAQDWLACLPALQIDCADHPEWFANINTPAELARYLCEQTSDP